MNIAHSSIYGIIEEFKEVQTPNEVKMLHYAAGGKRRKTVKKYQEVEERLQRLKTQLTSGVKNSIQYGDSASFILKLD